MGGWIDSRICSAGGRGENANDGCGRRDSNTSQVREIRSGLGDIEGLEVQLEEQKFCPAFCFMLQYNALIKFFPEILSQTSTSGRAINSTPPYTAVSILHSTKLREW